MLAALIALVLTAKPCSAQTGGDAAAIQMAAFSAIPSGHRAGAVLDTTSSITLAQDTAHAAAAARMARATIVAPGEGVKCDDDMRCVMKGAVHIRIAEPVMSANGTAEVRIDVLSNHDRSNGIVTASSYYLVTVVRVDGMWQGKVRLLGNIN